GRPRPVIDWLSDWKQRPNAESWMLYNLILMLQRVRRYDEALEVLRHAVTLRHSTDLYASFRIWAAFEEALRGNKEASQQQLALLPAEMITDARRPLHTM